MIYKYIFVILFFIGSEIFDEMLIIILGTSMFIGGATGFLLDNTIPGI